MRSALLVLVWALTGAARGVQPTGGYCIGSVCYALYETRGDFESARDVCSQHRGHLMTVRSSVAHDTLTLLLSNTTGQHWVGLHLPEGCPDFSEELRGYQWVTTDTSSDFYNWADSSLLADACDPSDPSAPRCVSVSKDDKFQWRQDPCQNQNGGFLCEYAFLGEGCTGHPDTFFVTPYGFRADDALTLPQGTIAEYPQGSKSVCVSGGWMEAPWSCEIQRGGCEHRCTVDPENDPTCYCPPGFIINPDNSLTCEGTDDDPCLKIDCAHACYEYGGSYLCTCNEGFVLASDNRSCTDLNECSDERQCKENEKCINTRGWFKCVCEDGYRLIGGGCADINECESAPCEHICTNKPGRYECSCYDGYKEDPKAPGKCKLHCGREECVAECDPNNKYQCYCPDGYILEEREDHSVCIDMDECEYLFCDQHCENTYGDYECFCEPGYTLEGKTMCKKDETGVTGVTEVTATVAPTQRPSGVSVGAFVGIIICTVFFILLAVFLIHRVLCGTAKADSPGALKASERPEAHNLQKVTTDAADS